MRLLSDTTKELLSNAFGSKVKLGLFAALIALLLLLKPGLKGVVLLVLSYHLVVSVYELLRFLLAGANPTRWAKNLIRSSLILLLFLHVISWLYYWFGAYGFWGILFVIVLLVTYRIVRNWKMYIAVKHEAERSLFGMTIRERHEQKKKERVDNK